MAWLLSTFSGRNKLKAVTCWRLQADLVSEIQVALKLLYSRTLSSLTPLLRDLKILNTQRSSKDIPDKKAEIKHCIVRMRALKRMAQRECTLYTAMASRQMFGY
jgi:hypothetical protein